MALFIWNFAPGNCLPSVSEAGGLASGLPAILGVIYISDIICSFDHDKSSSISQLINSKPKITQIF